MHKNQNIYYQNWVGCEHNKYKTGTLLVPVTYITIVCITNYPTNKDVTLLLYADLIFLVIL